MGTARGKWDYRCVGTESKSELWKESAMKRTLAVAVTAAALMATVACGGTV